MDHILLRAATLFEVPLVAMVDYSVDDDSDEELGAYIYRTSRTAKLFREEVSRDNDNETSTNNYKSNDIRTRKSKRKKPPEGENVVSAVLSISKVVRKRYDNEECKNLAQKGVKKQCSYEGCTNQVVNGGVCKRHGAKVKTCSHEGCTNYSKNGRVCIRHGAKKKHCKHEGCTKHARKGGVCKRHGANGKKYTCSYKPMLNK